MDIRSIKEFIKDFIKYASVAIAIFLLIFYVVSLQQVVGPSMNPTYTNGDVLILNKLQYRLTKPKRFEVVALQSSDEKYMIKRIIGIPGDKIYYRDDTLYINDEKVEEKFEHLGITEDFSLQDIVKNCEIIPEGYYLVLGDNREDSKDSRRMGLIAKKNIIGKIAFRIWPLFH